MLGHELLRNNRLKQKGPTRGWNPYSHLFALTVKAAAAPRTAAYGLALAASLVSEDLLHLEETQSVGRAFVAAGAGIATQVTIATQFDPMTNVGSQLVVGPMSKRIVPSFSVK
jgi:hypothetical protein